MGPKPLLILCTDLLREVLRLQSPADSVVSSFFRRHRDLGPRERGVLAETTYAVLRERPLWTHLARSGQGLQERRLAILAWRGDEPFLRGALSPAEQAWRSEVLAVDRSSLPAPLRHNLPEWLAARLTEQVGEDAFWPLAQALLEPAGLDLRVNTLHGERDAVQAALAETGVTAQPTPWSPWGLRLANKPALQKNPVFLRGDVEVQDEGSQLLAWLTAARRGEMVVDFCAGAGGKTLALGAMMRNTGRLYAFDVSAHRLDALRPRLARSGLSNVYPIAIAHERDDRIKRLAGKIDRVLVDAPCSGLGTLRRNPDLKWRHSPETVLELQAKQGAILASAARLLKPGGRLVYATCSLLREENEDIVSAFNAAHAQAFEPLDVAELVAPLAPDAASALTAEGHLRLWPHRHSTDGFFAAVWVRKG